MRIIFDSINVLLGITALVNFLLGFVVYIKGSQHKLNRTHAFTIFTTIGWIVAMIFYRSASSEAAMFWAMLLYISPTFIASNFLYFTYIFPTQIDYSIRKQSLVIYGINLLLILLIATPGLMITNVTIRPGYEKGIYFSGLYVLYFLYITSFFFYGYYRLFRKYLKSSEKIEKAQIRYLVVGYLVASNLAFVTNLSLPWFGYFELNWIGQIFTFFIIAFTTHAIIMHRLLDIKLVARQYSVYLATLIVILIPAWFIKYFFREVFAFDSFIIDAGIIAGSVSVFYPIRREFYNFANKHLFSSLYDSKQVMRALSEKLRSTLDLAQIYEHIAETILGAFHVKAVCIATYDEKEQCFAVGHNNGFVFKKQTLACDKGLYDFFITHHAPLSTDDFKKLLPDKQHEFILLLSSLGVEVIAPLSIKDKSVGLILLSRKESGDVYNDEDFQVLNVIGTQSAIALENAILYEQARQFTEKLKREIAAATAQLQIQNEELKGLDKAKSEFISVASHQLRTPLTATKWALEFLATGEKGRLSKDQKETIGELQEENKKLVRLVNELLNVSRLEENRVAIQPVPCDFVKTVKDIVHEFHPIAEHKKLKVIEKYDTLPLINLDAAVLGKAIHNIISNGIKYNRDGKKLMVTITKDGANALLIVKDEGIGIPKAEQDKLFQKFFRASNAASSNTEGSGLGLYIVKSAIELSGGTVRFESVEGKGTTFYVTLPLSGSQAIEGEKSLA